MAQAHHLRRHLTAQHQRHDVVEQADPGLARAGAPDRSPGERLGFGRAMKLQQEQSLLFIA